MRRVLVDEDGVEVCDAAGAVAEARRAIAELRLDAEGNAGGDPALEAEFGSDLFLLVRADYVGIICAIPLDDPAGQ